MWGGGDFEPDRLENVKEVGGVLERFRCLFGDLDRCLDRLLDRFRGTHERDGATAEADAFVVDTVGAEATGGGAVVVADAARADCSRNRVGVIDRLGMEEPNGEFIELPNASAPEPSTMVAAAAAAVLIEAAAPLFESLSMLMNIAALRLRCACSWRSFDSFESFSRAADANRSANLCSACFFSRSSEFPVGRSVVSETKDGPDGLCGGGTLVTMLAVSDSEEPRPSSSSSSSSELS